MEGVCVCVGVGPAVRGFLVGGFVFEEVDLEGVVVVSLVILRFGGFEGWVFWFVVDGDDDDDEEEDEDESESESESSAFDSG